MSQSQVSAKDLLGRMNSAWPAFRIAAGTLTDAQLDQPTPSGWTYRQMLGHVAAWHELCSRRLRGFRATGATDRSDDPDTEAVLKALGVESEDRAALIASWDQDRFNAAIAKASLRDDRHVLFTKLNGSFARLREEVEQLTDEQVAANVADGRPFAVAIVEGDSYGHYPEHQEELAAAAPKTGAALAGRIDEDWVRFREAVRHIGRARLADRIPGSSEGWTTYRDLIAHVIGWLEDVPRRIEAIRAGTHKPIASQQEIDEYNARSVATRALVGPEALIDELDTTYRRMRETVQGLSDEEVRTPRILLMVSVRTILHWEEHKPELEAAPARGATR